MNRSHATRILLVQGLFLVSGFCGLIYESIWSHYLKLFLGHAAYAQSVVLVVFIGGMALGAAFAGRIADRLRAPLVAYAAAEFVIGWAGIAFHPIFTAATGWAYDSLLPATCGGDGWCLSSWGFAASLILPQSVLLGMTFPLMTSGLLRLAPHDPGRRIALLYFLNSLGAVAGVLAGIFVLVPHAGLPGASLVAGTTNVLLAIAVYALAEGGRAPRPALARERRHGAAPWLLFAVAALTGLASFGYEIAWIRMLSLVLGASTHAFELMLASFILGLALGGAWIRRRIDRLPAPRVFLGCVQVAMGLAALASLALYDRAFDAMAWLIGALAKTDAGYLLFNAGSAAIAMAIMLPATFAAGMTLPLLTFLLLRDGYGERAIGYVYAWNTLGAIAGVLLAVHVGLPGLGLAGTLIAAASIDIALGVALIGLPRRARGGLSAAAIGIAGVAAIAVAPFVLAIDPQRTVAAVYRTGLAKLRPEMNVLYDRDGKTATVSVTRTEDGVVTIRTNGKPDASANLGPDRSWTMIDEATMVVAAALALRYRPDARDVAIIGFGSGMTTASFLGVSSLASVDTIEIEPMMIEGARHFGDKAATAYTDPRSRIVIDDAKSYFAKTGRRYDIIVSEPSNPWVAGVSSLFSEEFYRQAERHLTPDGVLVQWIQVYEFDQRLMASIVKAMLPSFPAISLFSSNGSDMLLVARRRPASGEDASAPFAHPDLSARLASVGILSTADLDRRQVIGPATVPLMFRSVDAPPNSDYFPIVELGAPAARFKGSSVVDVVELLDAPLPVIDLIERRPPPSALPPREATGFAERWSLARTAYEFLAGAGFADGAPLPAVPAESALANARLLLVDCVPVRSAPAAWDSLVTLSGELASALPAEDMERFVATIERSRCRAALPAATADWIRLFRGLGVRDAAATADAAATLLQRDDLTIVQREYALLAAIAGYLGSDRRGRAQQAIFAQNRHVRPEFRASPWYRLLQDIAMR
ncbi:MAG TPA: spermidine synthase [Casimicrobiaceae bacterium]|nr:spermidine synthase [Casimicrobiaceae bacterium]